MVDLTPFGSLADAAHIHQVRCASEQRDDAAIHERWRHHYQIVEMASAFPRIVGNVDVTLLHLRGGKHIEKMADRSGHRIDVTGRAGDGLGEHPAFEIKHTGRDVAGLSRGSAEGGAHESLRLLFHDGEQAVPHDLQLDLRKIAAHHTSLSSITMSSPALMRA